MKNGLLMSGEPSYQAYLAFMSNAKDKYKKK
jgi:hypothetical protein